jgi:hypothetical protein
VELLSRCSITWRGIGKPCLKTVLFPNKSNVKDAGVMLGVGGKGSRVVKRICRFKGVREITSQEIQVLAEKIADD